MTTPEIQAAYTALHNLRKQRGANRNPDGSWINSETERVIAAGVSRLEREIAKLAQREADVIGGTYVRLLG